MFVPTVLIGSAHLATAAVDSPDPVISALPAETAALAGLAPLPAAEPARSGTLTDEVLAVGTRLGIGMDRGAVADAVTAAGLAPELDTALAGLVVKLGVCATRTDALLARTPHADLVAGSVTPDPADAAALRACAVSLRAAVEAARPVLSTTTADGPLTLWPVLAYSPGETDDVYAEDFALLVDAGGDDTYVNNQGSNELDLKRSLTNPAAPRFGEPARGCRMTYPDSVSGRIKEEPGPNGERQLSFDGPECVPVAGLLWDMAGDDTYGRLEAPTFPDDQCSADPSVARFTTIGSGVEGVSMVIEDGGNDDYLGKTGTMGAGHMAGVGLLHDHAGDDTYTAIRNGQGLGLLAGTGILRDDSGDDTYDYYMPAPLAGGAPFHTDGSGGVVDDSGLLSEARRSPNEADGVGGRCDAKPRSLQGVGIFIAPAAGLLVDSEGTDSYRAAGYENQEEGFPTQSGTGLVRFAHGSQGSGFLGGIGMMFDLAGTDSYLREAYEPATDRGNGQTVGPQTNLSLMEEGSPTNGKPLDLSVFVDSE